MTLYAELAMSVLFIVVVLGAFWYNGKIVGARYRFHQGAQDALQTLRDEQEPKLPELVCTCGDCWELTGDRWQLIECGCDTTYKIFTEREDSL